MDQGNSISKNTDWCIHLKNLMRWVGNLYQGSPNYWSDLKKRIKFQNVGGYWPKLLDGQKNMERDIFCIIFFLSKVYFTCSGNFLPRVK